MSELVERVRRRLAGEGITRPSDLDEIVRAESGGIVDDAVLAALRREVAAELTGAGPLEPLLAMRGVTDVLVNAPDAVWFDRGHGMERAPARFADDAAVRRLAQRLAAAAGRRLDDAAPFVDAALPDGSRLHAVLPPLTARTTISLRVLARERHDLDDLVRLGTMPAVIAEVLRAVVASRLAFVLSGGTGTGKTTLLGALLGLAPGGERLVVIEDAAELVITHPHVVRLVTRAANVEGAGAIGLRELVRQALRMRPDRLVVGEFRGAEMVELIVALNTGHDGGCATLHANSAADVPARLQALGGLGGLAAPAVASLVSSAVEVVVHLRRAGDGRRVLDEIGLLRRTGVDLRVDPVWTARGGPDAAGRELARLFAERSVDVPAVLSGANPVLCAAPQQSR
ncbi:MAG: TadA family conjugal transfer-associated ATPase [Jatrophihabitantaceae bacterium]